MGFITEFKEFALKGNVMDMAVGVIIGGAFGKIVTSVIDDLLMPIVGMFGKADFSTFYFGLSDEARKKISETATAGSSLSIEKAREFGPILAYGNFVTVTINFLILAFCVFLIVKIMNTAKKRMEKEQAAAPPPEPPAEVKLLQEIRDALRARN